MSYEDDESNAQWQDGYEAGGEEARGKVWNVKLMQIIKGDDLMKSLRDLEQSLLEKRAELKSKVESVKEQLRDINLDARLTNKLTEKGVPTPYENFVEKKRRMRQLQGWIHRARGFRSHRLQEIEDIDIKLKEIKIKIFKREEELFESNIGEKE